MAPRKKQKQTKADEQHLALRTEGEAGSAFEEGHITVPLVEETLAVKKDWVQAGEVVLRKVVSAHTEEVPVQLGYEEVQVDRVAVNRVLDEGESAAPRQDGDAWVIPVIQEELVVLKRRVVREEIHVTKRRTVREETVREEVRSEDIKVETAGDLDYLNSENSQQP